MLFTSCYCPGCTHHLSSLHTKLHCSVSNSGVCRALLQPESFNNIAAHILQAESLGSHVLQALVAQALSLQNMIGGIIQALSLQQCPAWCHSAKLVLCRAMQRCSRC